MPFKETPAEMVSAANLGNRENDMRKPYAVATYRDTWAGPVAVELRASPSKRNGKRVLVYRWIEVTRGFVAGGMIAQTNPERAIRFAERNRFFSAIQRAS